jgi:transposase
VLVHDPVLAEAYRRMAQHYGFLISPTRPRTPRHKGKVESGVRYVKRNFMAGQEFLDIHAANQRLKIWVREQAGTREHGTTHQAPLRLFHESLTHSTRGRGTLRGRSVWSQYPRRWASSPD